jgi:hypothetical protein
LFFQLLSKTQVLKLQFFMKTSGKMQENKYFLVVKEMLDVHTTGSQRPLKGQCTNGPLSQRTSAEL